MLDTAIFDDAALYWPATGHLILSDLHLGRVPQAAGRSPALDYEAPFDRLTRLVDTYTPDVVVLNGDIFQHFPWPDEAVARLTDLQAQVAAVDGTLQLLEGNHEADVGGIEDGLLDEVPVQTEYHVPDTDTVVLHGHQTPTTPADRYIIGHMHPEVPRASGPARCYLYRENAAYESDVLILPAFSPHVDGCNIDDPPSAAGHCPLVADGAPVLDYTVLDTV